MTTNTNTNEPSESESESAFIAIHCDGGTGHRGMFSMFAIVREGDEEAAARAIKLHHEDFGTECQIRFVQEG